MLQRHGRRIVKFRNAKVRTIDYADAEVKVIRLLDEMLGDVSSRLGVRLWTGRLWPDEFPRPATLVLQHRDALTRMFSAGTELALAESYLRNDFDIEGNIETALEAADQLFERLPDWKQKLKLGALFFLATKSNGTSRPPKLRGAQHSQERDREAISFHYDLSNDFYRLWLDERMVYSCAYFESVKDSLAQAQEQKLDYICRKLRLCPGQELLDIGCGWGGLILYAAKNFGVHATGVTLSEQQSLWASRRIAEEKLESCVEVKLCDYREISSGNASFNAIVSVGMAEHVGREELRNYFAIAHRLLKADGVFLNHAIGEGVIARAANADGSFIEQYVFPNGDIMPLPLVLAAAESAEFEIRDVENLRVHYAFTLRHWLQRLEDNHAKALDFVSEQTYRTWRLYLAGCGHEFRRGHLAVYQTLLAKPHWASLTNLPFTRADWYLRKIDPKHPKNSSL